MHEGRAAPLLSRSPAALHSGAGTVPLGPAYMSEEVVHVQLGPSEFMVALLPGDEY